MKLNLEKINQDLAVIDPKIKSNVNWKALRSSRPDTFYSRVVIVGRVIQIGYCITFP